jgi:hypothetical protein
MRFMVKTHARNELLMLTVEELTLIQMAAMSGSWEKRPPRTPETDEARAFYARLKPEIDEMIANGIMPDLLFD